MPTWNPESTPTTWGEFKVAVEALGVKDSDGIRYIDWSGSGGPVEVGRDSNGDIEVGPS
jgi:primase-polymerase (primpol)-like protein